ncbi:MAG: PP2C family protein-serine/threonine phosphatase [Phycisphaerales bacterium JB038]
MSRREMQPNLPAEGLLQAAGDDAEPAVRGWGGGEVALLSRPAPFKTSGNEDAALVLPLRGEGLLLAVADGCGGMPAGAEAARLALAALQRAAGENESTEHTSALLAGFDAANQAVLDLRLGAGATLTAVLIEGAEVRIFYAGDSPAFIVGQRGALRYTAQPHSPTGFGVEAGFLSEREAMTHDDRSLVLNILGSAEMFVHVSQPVQLRPRDSVLLASDGLSDNLITEQIVDCIRVGSASAAVARLATTVRERMHDEASGHPDDLTLLLYRPLAHRGG